jgi:phosphate starvation-inducible protein PhoH and related proteins
MYYQVQKNISSLVCRARGKQPMRGKNKKYRSARGMVDEEDVFSDYYEEEALLGIMSPLSRSAPIHSRMQNIDWKGQTKPLKARNEKQSEFLQLLERPDIHILISSGSAGTGKTFMSVSYAMEKFQSGEIQKIVITRPMIAVDDKHFGAVPGGVIQKMHQYLLPILDTMHKYMSPNQVQKLLESSTIEACPLIHMRGRSFENCLIIADEMQNSTPSQMLMLLTRIGQNSKMIITGDPQQHDRGFDDNGLSDIINKLEKDPQEGFGFVKFTEAEVVRHPIIKKVLRLYHTKSVPSV